MLKKLQKQIENKLEKLQKLLEQITEAQVIDSNDPETWDSDTLYDLVENFKAALKLLQDQKSQRRNEFGETLLILEPGLCSLIDDYQAGEEVNYD